MGEVRVYIHTSCYSSYSVVKYLNSKGLLGKVRLVNVVNPLVAIYDNVISVPWVTVDGEPVATDPVSGGEIEGIIRGDYRASIGDPVKAFLDAVLSSSYASSIALLHGSLRPLILGFFVKAAIRYPYSGLDVGSVLDSLREEASSLYESLEFSLAKVVSVAYIRELYWASKRSIAVDSIKSRIDEVSLTLWLLAKASIGRAGIPVDPVAGINRDGVALTVSILEASWEKILDRVKREQEAIYSDREYIDISLKSI
ncbi:MAG: hypothetical protein QXD80_06745 [Acidilobaceae archaeon]